MFDFEVYRVAGARAAAAESLYRAEDGHWQFKYLPAFAIAVAPLAQLPPVAARAAWFFLSVGLVVLLVNRSLALLPDRRRSAAFLVWLTVLAMGKFYVREVGLGQSNLLLAVLVAGGRRLLVPRARHRGRRAPRGRHHRQAVRDPVPAVSRRAPEVERRGELRRRPARRAGPAGARDTAGPATSTSSTAGGPW